MTWPWAAVICTLIASGTIVWVVRRVLLVRILLRNSK